MTTPIIVLCLLLFPLCVMWGFGGKGKARFGGTLGIALAFAFFGMGHFVKTDDLAQMLPPFIPFAIPLIFITGVLEFAIAAGFLHPKIRRLAGLSAFIVLIAFFPANIYAALNHIGTGGHAWGPVYLLIRTPLQVVLIWWTWYFVLRRND